MAFKNPFRKKEKVDSGDDNFMLYIPQKKHKEWENRKGKVFLIFHHDKKAEKFLRWLVKKPTVSDLELDQLGSSVWKFIDGERNVHDISIKIKAEFGESCEPVNERLIMYLRHLNKMGWISFDKAPLNK